MKDTLSPIEVRPYRVPPHLKRLAVRLSEKIDIDSVAWLWGVSRSTIEYWSKQ